MGTLTTETLVDWSTPPTDPASLVAVFSIPAVYLGGILVAWHSRRRHDR